MCFWNDGADACKRQLDRKAASATTLSVRAAEALLVYQHSQTQWRAGPMGGRLGLDYAGVESVARMLNVPWDRERFLLVQRIEWRQITRDAEKRAADEAAKKLGSVK